MISAFIRKLFFNFPGDGGNSEFSAFPSMPVPTVRPLDLSEGYFIRMKWSIPLIAHISEITERILAIWVSF